MWYCAAKKSSESIYSVLLCTKCLTIAVLKYRAFNSDNVFFRILVWHISPCQTVQMRVWCISQMHSVKSHHVLRTSLLHYVREGFKNPIVVHYALPLPKYSSAVMLQKCTAVTQGYMTIEKWVSVTWASQHTKTLDILVYYQFNHQYIICMTLAPISKTRSFGALRAPTFVPLGLLDFVLRILRALRPCDPRRCFHDGP